ncbi:MAG: hypothetical protein WA672_17985 [Candidatus Angelobacter sp.]
MLEISEFRDPFGVNQKAVSARRLHHRNVVIPQPLPDQTHSFHSPQNLGFNLLQVLERQRDRLSIDQIETRAGFMHNRFQLMKQFWIIRSNDSAFIYAEILRQAADQRVCEGEYFPRDGPNALTCAYSVLFN